MSLWLMFSLLLWSDVPLVDVLLLGSDVSLVDVLFAVRFL